MKIENELKLTEREFGINKQLISEINNSVDNPGKQSLLI